ncbi:MAG: hypothetical protein DME26_09160 [Verrucomicrobia bacterium]|nr:MAG: hypothetical protein DME26_09160 [Verrucomicrobiota bacterium]
MNLKFLPAVMASARFPLTLTLSLGEREQQRSIGNTSNRARYADRLAMILPLPKGEGWGEGKGSD